MDQMKDFGVLKFIDKFERFFEKTGINYPVMRRLLQVMLIGDSRRSGSGMADIAGKKGNTYSSLFKGYLFSYGLLGVLIVVLMLLPFSLFIKMSIILGMVIVMVTTTLITDFSSVMLSSRDRAVLLPKPIDSRTLGMAEFIHALIYITVITLIIAGPSMVAGTVGYGLPFLTIFIIELLFIDIIAIFFTSVLYFLIFQFFDDEILKSTIKYFQFLLAIAVIIIYQSAGGTFGMLNTGASFVPRWWAYLIPSVWFAGPYSIFIEKTQGYAYIILSALCVLVPVILFFVYHFLLNPYFQSNLLLRLSATGRKRASFIEKMTSFNARASRIISWDREESIFFRFTRNMGSSERQLKLKLYPSLAYALVFPLIFLFTSFSRSTSYFSVYWGLSNSPFYLSIYITLVLLSNSYVLVYSSEQCKGAWIYRVLPVKDPSPIFKGSIKGFIMKYLFLTYVFIGFIFYLFYGRVLIPHLIVMFINLVILVIINFNLRRKVLPFSLDASESQGRRGYFVLMVSFIYCAVNALIEYFISGMVLYGMLIYTVVLLIALFVLWRFSFRQKWSSLR